MRWFWTHSLVALVVALAATPGLSWGETILDDFNDNYYDDDGLLFDTRTVQWDAGTIVSISKGALGVLDFTSGQDGWVTLLYSTNSAGIEMTPSGFELDGVFLGAADQTLTWTWTAKDASNTVVATQQDTWNAGDDPLFMDPDTGGTYSGWKTLAFRFEWQLDAGGAVSIAATRLQAVPEPASLVLLGMGALGLLGCVWRRRRRA